MPRRDYDWSSVVSREIEEYLSGDREKIDRTISHNVNAKWLITKLTNKDIMFKVYNLGAGVKRITTETDKCPCCGKKVN